MPEKTQRLRTGLDDGPQLPSEKSLAAAYRKIEAKAPIPCPYCGTGSKIHPVNAETCSRFEWQPISTAPKDGILILGFAIIDSQTGNWKMRIMSHDCYAEVGMRQNWNGWGDSWVRPTHWMPLPKPPKEETNAE